MKSSASKSKPFQSAPNWKAKFPAFLFLFFFYRLPFLESQFKAIILNKDCHDCYYTVTNTQKARNVLSTTHLGGSDVVCVHNMDKMGWVVESPMNYTIECCHGDACLGLSESRRFVEPSHSIWRSINVLLRRCSQPTTEKVAEPVWKPK